MIRFKNISRGAQIKVNRLRTALNPAAIDSVVAVAAAKVMRELVPATPKKWTGNLRKAWQVHKPRLGARLLVNGSNVMHWLEYGTANAGTGYIYPRVKKMLFIPLTRFAAMNGWSPKLKRGVDYILRFFVRGIKPIYLVRRFRVRARVILLDEMKRHISTALKSP